MGVAILTDLEWPVLAMYRVILLYLP